MKSHASFALSVVLLAVAATEGNAQSAPSPDDDSEVPDERGIRVFDGMGATDPHYFGGVDEPPPAGDDGRRDATRNGSTGGSTSPDFYLSEEERSANRERRDTSRNGTSSGATGVDFFEGEGGTLQTRQCRGQAIGALESCDLRFTPAYLLDAGLGFVPGQERVTDWYLAGFLGLSVHTGRTILDSMIGVSSSYSSTYAIMLQQRVYFDRTKLWASIAGGPRFDRNGGVIAGSVGTNIFGLEYQFLPSREQTRHAVGIKVSIPIGHYVHQQ